MRALRVSLAVIAAALALLVLAPPAGAATIDFDALPDGTVLADQFAAQGVLFGPTAGGTANNPGEVDAVGTAVARSGSRAVNITHNCVGEFCPADVAAQLPKLSKQVKLYAGTLKPCAGARAELRGFDQAGKSVASDSAALAAGQVKSLLQITAPARTIMFFRVRLTDGCGFHRTLIDDLTFDSAPGGPAFTLRWADKGTFQEALVLPPDTAKATAQIAVTRFGGSAGALSYAVSGAPSGVAATVTPTGADSAALELTATGLTAPVEGTITVTASGPATAGSGPPLSFPFRVRFEYDIRATGIDVSQGVQHVAATGALAGPTSLTQVYDATQNAVLAKGGRTVVRVYGDAPKVPAGACGVAGVVASLSATAGGQELPGSPLSPDTPPRQLGNPTNFDGACPPSAFSTIRYLTNATFQFTLPAEWTERSAITLTARLSGPGAAPGSAGFADLPPFGECETCGLDNAFTLQNVPFTEVSDYPGAANVMKIAPIWLYIIKGTTTTSKSPDAQAIIDAAMRFTPHREGSVVVTELRAMDVSDVYNANTYTDVNADYPPIQITNAVRDGWALAYLESLDDVYGNVTLGLVSAAGRSNGMQNSETVFVPGQFPTAVVETARPLTSVAHEIGHSFGRPHASACNGGNAGDQIGEPWPPDQRGFISPGFGLELLPAARDAEGYYPAFGTFGSPIENSPTDFMSYCATEGNGWISLRGWNAQGTFFGTLGTPSHPAQTLIGGSDCKAAGAPPCPDPQPPALAARAQGDGHDHDHAEQEPPRTPLRTATAAAAPAAAGNTTRISAIVAGGQALIVNVARTLGGAPVVGARSPYTLSLAGAGGAPLATAAMAARVLHSDRPGAGTLTLLEADVPTATLGKAAILALADATGAPMTQISRSAHRPSARLLNPGAGAYVGLDPKRTSFTVRWRSGDADGGRRRAALQYSADGGKRWRTVFAGPDRQQATVAMRLLSASDDARLRLTVSDGINERTATSLRFRSRGAAPEVTIAPAARQRLRADATLTLAGTAIDDGERVISGRRLRWFDGTKLIGSGRVLRRFGLAPGAHTIRLVATDLRGRRGSAAVRVTVTPVAPRFLRLQAPARISRFATRLPVVVQSNVAAALRLSRSGFSVSHAVRRINLKITPGATPLEIPVTLRAGAQRLRALLRVARGPFVLPAPLLFTPPAQTIPGPTTGPGPTAPPPPVGPPPPPPPPGATADLNGSLAVDAVTLTVRNTGTGAAGAFVVRVASAAGNQVETWDVAGLAAGASASHTFGCAGDRIATIDAGNQVPETNETNNTVNMSCKP